MERKIIQEGVTFDDVLLIPDYSEVTPDKADLSTRLTRNIRLNVPLVSAPMDTVTESALAIALAQEGGIGIIHRTLAPEDQAREVALVKRSENGVINDPVTLAPSDKVDRALKLMDEQNVSGFPVTADGSNRGRVVGILTRRDLKFVSGPPDGQTVENLMTKENLVTASPDTTLEAAETILNGARGINADSALSRLARYFGTSENAVKTQIWIAASIYVLVAIIEKRLDLKLSPYTNLQILRVTIL